MVCGGCGASRSSSPDPCPHCGAEALYLDRFLLLEPLADGSRAVDTHAHEGVRLWQARRFVPEGVEQVADRWVSNTDSEARVLEAMEPMEDLFDAAWLFQADVDQRPLTASLHEAPVRVERRRLWKAVRPVVMVLMTVALVPLALAASPPPPDYGEQAAGREELVEMVRRSPPVQACLAAYRSRNRVRDVAHPAVLRLQTSSDERVAPVVRGSSGDPELTACVVRAAASLQLPAGPYALSVPVGEEPPSAP